MNIFPLEAEDEAIHYSWALEKEEKQSLTVSVMGHP